MLNGFVGEFLVLLGAFDANVTFAVVATSGVILSAVYMLWMYQRVIFGEVTNPKNQKLADLDIREKMDTSVNQVLQHLKSSAVVVKN